MVSNGLQLIDSQSLLIFELVDFVFDCVFVYFGVGYIFDEVLPSVVFVVVIVLYSFALPSHLLASLYPCPVGI